MKFFLGLPDQPSGLLVKEDHVSLQKVPGSILGYQLHFSFSGRKKKFDNWTVKNGSGRLRKGNLHRRLIFERPFLTKKVSKCSQIEILNLDMCLSRFGGGVRGSFIVSNTDTFDKIAKFISTRNAMYGMFKL